MTSINFDVLDMDTTLDLFAGEPTESDLDHEEVVDVKAWNYFRCKRCRKSQDMLKCKSHGGYIICRFCGQEN